MYWTLELASKLEDAPWPATRDELLDWAFAVFANNGTAQLRLALSENQIKISAQDIDFSTSAEETISCDYNGTPMAIGFKAPFLIDLLGSIASTDVQLKLADPARAGLILPVENVENEDILMLLMPMLLND